MNVHQVVHNSGLDVSFMLMHQNLFPSIEDFHEGVVTLRYFIQWLVLFLIVLNSFQEIVHDFVFIFHSPVIRAVDFHFLQG